MARRNRSTRRAVRRGPPCKNVQGFPYTGEAPTSFPSAFFGIQNGRLQGHGQLNLMTVSGSRTVNVQVRRVDYVGPQGKLILRIVPGAPMPQPTNNVRQIRVCYVKPAMR